MHIRKIQKRDLPELAILYKEFWNEESDLSKMISMFEKIDNNPSYLIFNAFENGVLVGTIMGIICDDLYGKCDSFLVIEDFIVQKAFRCKGIGNALLIKLENEARMKHCVQSILVTESHREEAQSFYESHGYKKGTHIGYKKNL